MIGKKLIFPLLLLSTVGWTQTQTRVPAEKPPECDAIDCENNTGDNSEPTDAERQDLQVEPITKLRSPSRRSQSLSPDQLRALQGMQGNAERVSASTLDQKTQSRRENFPPEPPTEFQKFVFSSTGQRLTIQGQSLFQGAPSTFAPVDQVPVPSDYTIGPGDELLIRVWGQIDLDAKVTVDRNGQIYLPKVGTLTVAGLKYDQLGSYLKTSISRLFKNFDLSVGLGQLRSIQVFVVGRARRPGAYTIGSLSTLVNALFASGGPDANGSLRRIKVMRQDQLVSEFDLYDLIVKGDKTKDVVLHAGDVILIPPVGPQVAIFGSVNSPAIYELRDQNSVREVLDAAGGLSTTADSNRALLERIDNRSTRKVEEFPLDRTGLSRQLRGGDVLRVFPVSPRFENAVTLRGNVAQPGRFPWRQGMRVRDLIPSREALVTRDYWARQNQLGDSHSDWIDRTAEEQKQMKRTQAAGQLENVDRSKEERTDIKRNPSEINWDYAVVQRLNPEDLTSRLIPFNLGQAISDLSSEDNLALNPGDVVTIFSQSDVSVPVAKRTKFIRIEGEVKAAGVYRVEPGESLRDIVVRAGGLTAKAYLFAADFRRESTRLDQQKRLEAAADQIESDLRAKATEASSAANPEDRTAALQQIEQQRQALQQFKSLKATGRIVLDLKPDDVTADALPAIELEDGDTLVIPSIDATVQVVGSVYNQSAFLYEPGKTLKRYLTKAGGETREADGSRVFVIRADGSVISKQMHSSIWSGSFDNLKLMAGDTVVVPSRIRTTSVLREIRDWSQVFAQFALGAAAIHVLTN